MTERCALLRRVQASTTIQAAFRMASTRKVYVRQHVGALKLQSFVRMRTAMLAFSKMLAQVNPACLCTIHQLTVHWIEPHPPIQARLQATYEGQIAEARARLEAQAST
ncbi:MAG: hypothetical protein SGPRY_000792 [Prymnesium sp.]